MVRRVSALPSRLLKGADGERGDRGARGEQGAQGLQGAAGAKGPQGTQGGSGPVGHSPGHEVQNGEIRFLQPDGQWGEWISITSPSGGGKLSENTYTAVTAASFTIPRRTLDLGINIFGVRVTPATILLPKKVDKRSIIVIKDEVGDAGTDNITIQVET